MSRNPESRGPESLKGTKAERKMLFGANGYCVDRKYKELCELRSIGKCEETLEREEQICFLYVNHACDEFDLDVSFRKNSNILFVNLYFLEKKLVLFVIFFIFLCVSMKVKFFGMVVVVRSSENFRFRRFEKNGNFRMENSKMNFFLFYCFVRCTETAQLKIQ